MKEQIIEALRMLDTSDDENWTADGAPLMSKIEDLVGQDVTRDQVTEAAPGFSRGNPILPGEKPEPGENLNGTPEAGATNSTSEDNNESADAMDKNELEKIKATLDKQQDEIAKGLAKVNKQLDSIARKEAVENDSVAQAENFQRYLKGEQVKREAAAAQQKALVALLGQDKANQVAATS